MASSPPAEVRAVSEPALSDIIDQLPIYHRARREWELYKRLHKEADWVLKCSLKWRNTHENVFSDFREILDALKDY